MNDDFLIHFAGVANGNTINYAYYVTETQDGEEIHKFTKSEQVQGETAFLPEYKAILHALLWLYKKGYHKDKFIRFLGHCEPVIEQMNEKEVLREYPYKETAVRCLTAKNEYFWMVEFEAIPEDFNMHVTALAEGEILKTV